MSPKTSKHHGNLCFISLYYHHFFFAQLRSHAHWARAKRRLFERLDPLATSALPRRRFESALAGTVTLSGLRLLLAEVVPGVSSGWKKWQVL